MVTNGRSMLAICAIILHATAVTSFMGSPGLPRTSLQFSRLGLRPPTTNVCMQETATAARWPSEVIAQRRATHVSESTEAVEAKGGGKKLQKFFKALKKPKGTISIIGEIKRKDPNDAEFAVNMPDPSECSKAFHDSKLAAVAVWVDEELYGCSINDLKDVVAAQASFKGEFPGPCPVLACGVFVSPQQVVEVASTGAGAMLLSASVLEKELSDMIECAKATGIESVVLCASEEEIDGAIEAGAAIVALDGKLLGTNETIAMVDGMEGRDKVVLMAFGGVSDIADAWRLRDAGCNSVAVGTELLYAAYGKEGEVRQGGGKDGLGSTVVRGDVLQLNDVKAFARGLMAKASVKYASSSLNAFKEQGAGFKRHYTV